MSGLLKTGVVSFRLDSEWINHFKGNVLLNYRKPVIVGQDNIFCTTIVFFPLFYFLWLQGHAEVLDCMRGQQSFWHVRLLSENLPLFFIASTALQMGASVDFWIYGFCFQVNHINVGWFFLYFCFSDRFLSETWKWLLIKICGLYLRLMCKY